LRRYCYVVAGIVGEMLTDIFVKRIDGFHTSDELRKSANVFGEGLQLVNILNDSAEDARRGRSFLPSGVERADVFALARQDLRDAEYFVDQLRASAAPAGYLAFSRLPLELALATLDVVERDGPGSKISREEVARILHRVISPQSEAANSS
jgi:farnesyl-diphosphate farnesyltransferase